MGKFVAKKNFKINFKIVGLVLVGLISMIVTFNVIFSESIERLLGSSLGSALLDQGLGRAKFSFNALNPKDLLEVGMSSIIDVKNVEDIKTIKNHKNSLNPSVYIYNTHEAESYSSSLVESYSIKYTIKIGSYLLADYLKDLGVESFVEGAKAENFTENFESPYEASRVFVSKRLQEYKGIKLAIDLHRDAVSKEESTTSIDGKAYAKILFVVGISHDKASSNLETAKKLSAHLDPRILRGIIEKNSDDGDGIYNQDLSSNIVLIEVGGAENTIVEVDNTLKLLAEAIFKYLGDEKNE